MTKIVSAFSHGFSVPSEQSLRTTTTSSYLPEISRESLVTQPQSYLLHDTEAIMTYRDVVSKSGMSWSNMLKETAHIEFKHLSTRGQKRSSNYCRRLSQDRHHNPYTSLPYHWTRTENLEHEQLATDRPYRNTYGDGRSQPSKLHLSTEFPDLPDTPLSVEGVGQSPQSPGNEKFKHNHKIAKIYNLLHDGDIKQLSRLHVFTRRRPKDKNLPMILPHFHMKLTQSINRVLKDAEIQPDAIYTRRPMTSEHVTYYPITEKSANPELVILKTGKVKYREKKSVKQPIPKTQKSSPIATPSKEPIDVLSSWDCEPSLTARKLPKVERDSTKGRMITKGVSITPRYPANKTSSLDVSKLHEAEGFPLSVKITPKVHPANEKPRPHAQE